MAASSAWATSAEDEAKSAYGRAAAAYDAGDFATAAQLCERADNYKPNAVALNLGLAAALRADDALIGMNLATRADKPPVDASTADLAAKARARFASRVGLVRVVCAAGSECALRIGVRRVGAGEVFAALPGEVAVTFETGSQAKAQVIAVAGRTVDLVEPEPPPVAKAPPVVVPIVAPQKKAPAMFFPPRPAPVRARGLAPGFFWGGVALTAIASGATVYSGLDASDQHDAFLAARTEAARESGQDAQTRTNVILGVAITAAVATTVVGIFFTRWNSASPRAASRGAVLVF